MFSVLYAEKIVWAQRYELQIADITRL